MRALRRTAALCLTVAVGILVSSLAAHAVPVTFFGEDLGLGEDTPLPAWPNSAAAEVLFNANLFNVGTEDLEAFADLTPAPLPVTFPGSGITATLQGNGWISVVPVGQTNGVGRYAISGTHSWDSSDVFYLEFSEPVAAFGFYGVDIGDFSGNLTLTLTTGARLDLVVPHTPDSPGGTVIYYGFYDEAQQYVRIDFGNTAPGVDYFGFDDFKVGSIEQVVPVGACCIGSDCYLYTSDECTAVGGDYMGDGTGCDPNPCPSPVETASWGVIKGLYKR